MSFEQMRAEKPAEFYNLKEVENEIKKIPEGELMKGMFWLVNSRGEPVTRTENLAWSSEGDQIVFVFRNAVRHSPEKSWSEPLAMELTGQNKVDFIEHKFDQDTMRSLMEKYGAVGFQKVPNLNQAKTEERPVILGQGYDNLRKATADMYRTQIEGLVSKMDTESANDTVSDEHFARALSRIQVEEGRSGDQETKISFKDLKGRNAAIDLKYLSSMLVPGSTSETKPGIILRLGLPERTGEDATLPHTMPSAQSEVFAAFVHILRNPKLYPKTAEEFKRLKLSSGDLQTREWLQPPSKEEHRNMLIPYERIKIVIE